MSRLKWWGYRHTNGSLHTKRYLGELDLTEARESPFVAEITGPFEADSGDLARREVIDRFTEQGAPPQLNENETVNPKWLRASMTVEQAARAARQRNCYLKATYDGMMGLRIVAIRYPQNGGEK